MELVWYLKREKFVYFSDNHMSIGMWNPSLMTPHLHVSNARAIQDVRKEGSYFLQFFVIVSQIKP